MINYNFFYLQNFFSTNKEADKIRHVQKQVDEVKDVMMENIGNYLNITIIVDYHVCCSGSQLLQLYIFVFWPDMDL